MTPLYSETLLSSNRGLDISTEDTVPQAISIIFTLKRSRNAMSSFAYLAMVSTLLVP